MPDANGVPTYAELAAENQARDASLNLGSAEGVAPSAAIGAFKAAPTVGVAPDLGMVTPDTVGPLYRQAQDQAHLANPAIRSFASQSPAHVAATREDWGNFANLATVVKNDFLAPAHAAGAQLATDIARSYFAPKPQGFVQHFVPLMDPRTQRLGSVAADVVGVVGSGFAGLANVAARPLSYIPMYDFKDGKMQKVPQEEAQARLTNDLLTATMGAKPALRRPVIDLGAAQRVPPEGPNPNTPLLPAPSRPGVNPAESPVYTHVAEADAASVKSMEDAVAATSTHSQLPALVQDFLEHTDASGRSVWVDPQAVLKLYSEGETPLAAFGMEIGAALNEGREVAIPLSAYLADVSGKPYADALRSATRFREDGVSVDEGKELGGAQPPAAPVEGEAPVALAPVERAPIPEDIEPELHAPLRELAAQADAAVETVFKERTLDKLFEPGALKLSQSRMDRYDAALMEAKAAASDRILQRVYNQIRKERTPEWKAAVERRVPALSEAIKSRPEVAAWELLTTPGYKIDRDLAETFFPGSVARLPPNMFKRDGNHPDDVADALGFPSGAEMLDTLAGFADLKGEGSIAQFVAAQAKVAAEAQARLDLGFDLSPEGILEAAREEAVLPQLEDFLEGNLADIAKELGLPFDKGMVEVAAKEAFDRMPVRAAMRPQTFERGMWRTGERAAKALEKGDFPEAFRARQAQLLNFHQLKMSHFLAKKFAQGEKKFRRLAKKEKIAGLSQPFLDQLHAYLPRWGYPSLRNPAELEEALGGVTLPEFVDGVQETNAAFPDVPQVASSPLRDLSVDDYWKVRGFIFAMDKYGRELQRAARNLKRENFAAQREAALASVPPGKPPKKPPPDVPADQEGLSGPQKFLSLLRSYDAMHRKPADLVEWLDRGDPLGIWHQSIIAPLYEGANMEGRLHREVYEPLVSLWEKIPRALKRGYSTVVPSPFTVGPGGRKMEMYRRNVPMLALYTGTAESLEKAANGLGTDPATLVAWVSAHIAPEEVDLVEGVWEKFAEIAPMVSETLRRMTGVGLDVREPQAVTLGGRTLRGGYVPIEYDRRSDLNPEVAKWEAEKEATLSPDGIEWLFGEVLPNRGFSEALTNYVGVVDMGLDRLTRMFNSHIKYAAYAQPISDVRKFVFDPLIARAIEEKFGPEYLAVIPEWLNGVVMPLQAADRNLRGFDRAAEWLGRNITTATLAGSYGTLVAQAAGWLNGVAVLSEGNLLRGVLAMLGGTKDTLGALTATQVGAGGLTNPAFGEMFAKSEFMRERYGSLEQNMTEALAESDPFAVRGRTKQALQHTERFLFHLIGWMEFVSASAPIWLAAEKQALAAGMDAEKAVKFADRKVIKSQGSGRRVDQSAIQRARGIMKLMYAFQSYFNQQYQLTVDIYRNVAGAGMGGGPPRLPPEVGVGAGDGAPIPPEARYSHANAAIIFLTVMVLTGVMANFLTKRKNKWWDPLTTLLRPMFVLNSVAYNVDQHFDMKDGKVVLKSGLGDKGLGDDQLSRAAEIVLNNSENAWKLAHGKKPHRLVQNLIQLPTPFMKLPGANQVARSAEYLAEVGSGEQKPRSGQEWVDVMTGLRFGPRAEQKVEQRTRSRTRQRRRTR